MEMKNIIEKARNELPGNYNRIALEAFEAGKNFEPPCFEYGLGTGNYVSDLVAKDGVLYYVKRMPEYKTELVRIAKCPYCSGNNEPIVQTPRGYYVHEKCCRTSTDSESWGGLLHE